MPRITLIADVNRRTLLTGLPEFTQGDLLEFELGLVSGGNAIHLPVRSMRASFGYISVNPESGYFTIKIADDETGRIAWDSSAEIVESAIRGLPSLASYGGAVSVAKRDESCWVLRFNHTGEVPIEIGDNSVYPRSFCRVRAYSENGKWFHEIRIMQAPVAYSGSHDRRIANPPTVERIIAGNSQSDGLGYILTNEVQAITVPPDFDGTYSIKINGRTSAILSPADDIKFIQDALNRIYTPVAQNFIVTNPELNKIYVEFAGEDFSGAGQDLLEIVIGSVQPGNLTFEIDLNTAEVADVLRSDETVDLSFEVELEIGEDGEDVLNPNTEDAGKKFTLFQSVVTINRELQYEEMAVVEQIDWLRPPQPKSYIPFSRDQVITGSQYYCVSFGDGEANTFVFDHNLGTEAIMVSVRENNSGGAMLSDGDYSVVVEDANSISVTVPGDPPGVNGLAIVIVSAGPKSAFSAHTHTVGDITGLQDIIDDYESRVSTLEEVLPTVGGGGKANTSIPAATIEIIGVDDVLFLHEGSVKFTKGGSVDPEGLPQRTPYMLPACHDASVTTLPEELPDPAANSVWENEGESPVTIQIGGGIRPGVVDVNGFVGSDGRVIYPVTRSGDTNSYFPSAFERELFTVFINDRMLRVGGVLTTAFAIKAQLINARSNAQWVFVLEQGALTEDDSPAVVAQNVSGIEWSTIFTQRILLTRLMTTHPFGVSIKRNVSSMSCDKMSYGVYEGANGNAPASANFALRARLCMFDTESSTENRASRGWVYYGLAPVNPTDESIKISIQN